MESKFNDEQLGLFGEFITRTMGLHFPPSRWPELGRGLAAAAAELEIADVAGWMYSLMSGPLTGPQLELLAHHLTIGETYFFRDSASFEALSLDILPALASAARKTDRSLRIWSAACCTGEEPYSISIILQRSIPDWRDWNISLLATDLNPRFLQKAAQGVYGAWSFRNAPPWLKEHYFKETPDGRFEVRAEIRQMVQFAPLNLVDDAFPSMAKDAGAMDIIFCRNVLMYFSAEQARKVIDRLGRAQAQEGWLVVGANDLTHAASGTYKAVQLRGSIVYQKSKAGTSPELHPLWRDPAPIPPVSPRLSAAPPSGKVSKPVPMTVPSTSEGIEPPARPPESTPIQKARALANEGQLDQAMECCDSWIQGNKFDHASHYLRAVILLEKGEIDQAVGSLRRALYLAPKFVLAHYAMGNIARDRGQAREADRHMANVMHLLQDCPSDQIVPESDGVTVARFTQIVSSLISAEAKT